MQIYQIQLAGHLDQRWEAVFDGFSISHQLTAAQQPITLLTGPIADQAALYGLISRLRDLGMTLIGLWILPSSDHRGGL